MGHVKLPPVYPILDTAACERLNADPIRTAAAMLKGGAQILQFRHKAFWSRQVFEQARQIAELCRNATILFVVNDRADYAHILGAALHVGQEDLLPTDARRVVGPDAIIGYSTHNPQQMRAASAEPIDYVAFGPVFATTSKERPDPSVGLEILREVRALTTLPLVAIGGITLETAPDCWQAGADSLAVISALLPDPCSPSSVRNRTEEWMREAERAHPR